MFAFLFVDDERRRSQFADFISPHENSRNALQGRSPVGYFIYQENPFAAQINFRQRRDSQFSLPLFAVRTRRNRGDIFRAKFVCKKRQRNDAADRNAYQALRLPAAFAYLAC